MASETEIERLEREAKRARPSSKDHAALLAETEKAWLELGK